MKYVYLLFIIVVVSQGCSEKKEKTHNVKDLTSLAKTSGEKNQKSRSSSLDVRQAAIANLGSLTIKTPEDLKKYRSQLESFSEKLAKSEDLSLGDARNELFLALTERQPKAIQTGVKAGFFQVILNDPRGIAAAMGELPAGDLRKSNVAFIRGTKISLDEYEKIYRAMPESADRTVIAQSLVSGYYSDHDVSSAIELIRSLDVSDTNEALKALVDQIIWLNNDVGTKFVNPADIDKVKDYAISIGQEPVARSLSRLNQKK